MIKHIVNHTFLFLIFYVLFNSTSTAQYIPAKHYTGPSIGLSFLGSSFQFGVNYEYGINIENFGNIGVGGILRYWGYSENFTGGKWSYTNILIGAQGNYHFAIHGNEQLDPYAGIVLAYDGGSVSYSGPGKNYPTPSHGGLWIGAQGGLRYWLNPNLALTGRVGFGTLSYGALEVGIDLKF
jgi:hypothetical protein